MFLIAVAIFFLVEGLIIWTVLRYRRRPGDDTLPAQTHGNAIAEIVWTVVPTLIVAFLFVISWQTLNTVEVVSAEPQTRVQAVAGQFQWTFEYLDASGENTASTPSSSAAGEDGGLVVPAGRTVQLSLESPDVIHAFYVPQFLFKRDVVPGRINDFEFTINEEDAGQTFRGQCAELCGAGHRLMLFDVHAVTPAEFDAWLEQQDRRGRARARPRRRPSGARRGRPATAGRPSAGPAPAISASTLPSSRPPCTPRPTRRSRSSSTTRTRRSRTTSRSTKAARPGPTSSGRDLPGVGQEDLRRPGARRRAPTPSCARSIRP